MSLILEVHNSMVEQGDVPSRALLQTLILSLSQLSFAEVYHTVFETIVKQARAQAHICVLCAKNVALLLRLH